MKSLISKIANTNIGIKIRNSLGFRPIPISFRGVIKSSVSDAFCWRTDSNFSTIFKYTDILNLFYKIDNSYVEFHFYTNKNKLIKRLKFNNLNYSNSLTIDSKLLNGIKDYGTFYIYHFSDQKIKNNTIIANRCYLGYSKNKQLHSFVHGNVLAKFKNLNNLKGKQQNSLDIIKTSYINNGNYKIQNYFKDFDKTELFFANPTSEKIEFLIGKNKYILLKGCSKIIETTNQNSINIKSNCLFLRPTIFNYKNEFIDVYHG